MLRTHTPPSADQRTREKILLVDDSMENVTALEAVLDGIGQEVIKANSGFEALRHCLDHDFAAIILDVKTPEMDSFETASLIRARERSQKTPILFLTSFRNEEHLVRGCDLGAVDFLFKPIVAEVLQSKVSVFVELSRNSALLRIQAEEIRNLNQGLERKIAERTTELLADIAERKRVEKALRESEQRLRMAIDAANLGLWSIDSGTQEFSASRRTAEMFGFGESYAGGFKEVLALVNSEDRNVVLENLSRALAGEAEFNCEFRVITKEFGVRWIACKGRLLEDVSNVSPRIVGVAQDVTDRKTADDNVLQKHKLESLGTLAGGIAHDFNNLLTGVLGHASIVLDDVKLDPDNRECVESIVVAAETAAQLTRQMLAYSGRGRFMVEPVHLSDRIRDLHPLFLAAMPKNVTLELKLEDDLPFIEMDNAQFQQLLLNLVLNGAEAVGLEDGFVSISTRLTAVTERMLRSSHVGREIPAGDYVALQVSDNGHGMDEKTLSRIFDPFFTTKFTGRGLGLAAVIGIVRAHKGAILTSSEPGKGTTFTVFFPPSFKPIETTPAITAPLKRSNGVVPVVDDEHMVRNISRVVMVVDDEDIVRNTARVALERCGFTVVLARNGFECVEMVAETRNHFDAILLDMAMPVMGGEQAFRRLNEIRPGLPVIATSGYDESETVSRFGSGLAGFLHKPYTAGQLIAKVQALTPAVMEIRSSVAPVGGDL